MHNNLNQSKIMVVDSDKDVLLTLSNWINTLDLLAITVQNGKGALQLLAKDQFTIVIQEMQLPDMKGMNLLKKIKTTYRDTGVVITSAEKLEVIDLQKRGALAILQKPIDAREFSGNLRTIFTDHRKTKRFHKIGQIICSITSEENPEAVKGTLENISLDGALIETQHSFPVGQVVEIEFTPEGEEGRTVGTVRGKVVRAQEEGDRFSYHIAVYFYVTRDAEFLKEFKVY